MTISGIAAFWSYSHEDDELDRGAVLKLAENIRDEFALITGDALTLFSDRTGIAWGDEWRRRINGALAETTFFIPVITPRYFTRVECRRELLEFSSQAESLGVSELILPIRYAKIKDFSERNPDEAVALVARMQYVDWTQLRLREQSSSEYKAAVNALAIRLAELADTVAEKQLAGELQEVRGPAGNQPGLSDLFEQINAILPEWIEAIDNVQIDIAQMDATHSVYDDRLRKAERSGPASATFAILQRLASDLMPIAERSLKRAQVFETKSIELDPLILNTARIGADHPADRSLFAELHSAIMVSHGNYLANLANRKDPKSVLLKDWAAQRAHTSRAMRRLSQISAVYSRTIDEANKVVENWVEQFRWLEKLSPTWVRSIRISILA